MLEFAIIAVNSMVLASSGLAINQTIKARRKFIHGDYSIDKSLISSLPSVTVCIPARNEDHALTDCLQAVLASDYEKLEVIVLDDNSVDNTSVLIKSFAHAGVRFVNGGNLPAGWIGKNYALQRLSNEASGSVVIFMDVDTRLEPDSITKIISYMVKQDSEMVSVMPVRRDGWRLSVIFSPLRYFWEIVLHTGSRPPTSSSFWAVNRGKLLERGGFEAVKSEIRPELNLISHFLNYRFIISNSTGGIAYEKKLSSQLETSIRLASPTLKNSLASSFIVAIDLLLLLVPAILLIVSPELWQKVLALTAVMSVSLSYTFYTKLAWLKSWPVAFFIWPYTIIQESVLIITSYFMHKFEKVSWKGRSLYKSKEG